MTLRSCDISILFKYCKEPIIYKFNNIVSTLYAGRVLSLPSESSKQKDDGKITAGNSQPCPSHTYKRNPQEVAAADLIFSFFYFAPKCTYNLIISFHRNTDLHIIWNVY